MVCSRYTYVQRDGAVLIEDMIGQICVSACKFDPNVGCALGGGQDQAAVLTSAGRGDPRTARAEI